MGNKMLQGEGNKTCGTESVIQTEKHYEKEMNLRLSHNGNGSKWNIVECRQRKYQKLI